MKKHYIICVIILIIFSAIIIPLYCSNQSDTNGALVYFSDYLRECGYNEYGFEFYDLNDNLTEDLKIVVNVKVTERKENGEINTYNSKIEFTEIRKQNSDHAYEAEIFFTNLTSSTYQFKVMNAEYTTDNLNFKKMERVSLFDFDVDKSVAEYKKSKALNSTYLSIISIGYTLLAIALATPLVLMAIKSVAKHIAKQNIEFNKEILSENKDDLSLLAMQNAEIMSEAVTITTKSIKEGMAQKKPCKHCGVEIQTDSVFCNYCGKEQ